LGRLNAITKYEAEVMKDVEGWVPGASVYNYRWLRSKYSPQLVADDVDLP
jgi:hypothetical protein